MVKERRCVVCDAAEVKPLFRARQSPGPVVRCRRCGLVYVAPIEDDRALISIGPPLGPGDPAMLTSANATDLVGCWEYPLLAQKETESAAIYMNAGVALEQIERYALPPGRLLDFGCGGGFFLSVAKERGWEAYGLEPLPGHAVYARARFKLNVITDVLRADTFAAEFFDVVTAFQVFEHIVDPNEVLEHLKAVMRPGGILFIEVPNIETWSLRLLGKYHRHFVPDHVTFFSRATLSRLLERNGFRVLDSFFPSRQMSLNHLLIDWGGGYFLRRTKGPSKKSAAIGRMLDRIVPVNIGDIVAVISQKIT
jgi:SAM-dependent methyltransferase